MPRRKRKPGSRQQPKRRNAAAKALARPRYRQRVVPKKQRRYATDDFSPSILLPYPWGDFE